MFPSKPYWKNQIVVYPPIFYMNTISSEAGGFNMMEYNFYTQFML